MQRIITSLTVLLLSSTVYAQVDPGHSILRSAAFSRSGSCADGSCGTPTTTGFAADSGYNDAGSGCPDGNCRSLTAYSQPMTSSYGGCADGSCDLPASYMTDGYASYETTTSYVAGNCADGSCALPAGNLQFATANYGGCADGSCGLAPGYVNGGSGGTDNAIRANYGDAMGGCADGSCNVRTSYFTDGSDSVNYDTADETVTGYARSASAGCADGSCGVYRPSFDPAIWVDSYVQRASATAASTAAADREFFSDSYPTSYLDETVVSDYANRIQVIRRAADVDSRAASAGSPSVPTFSAFP